MTTTTRPRVPKMDSEHLKALRRIIDEAQQTRFGTLSLDTRKPHHLHHLTQTFVGPKKAAPYFPHTQGILEQVVEDHKLNDGPRPMTLFEMDDAPVNTFMAAAKILYCNVLADTVTVAVGGVITLLQSAYSVSANLVIMDMNTNQPIANVTPPINTTQYSQQVAAQGTLTQPPNISAVLTCVITPVSGGPSTTLVDTCLYQGVESVQSVTVVDPVTRFQPPRGYIKIGLNRDSSNRSDCDYYYQYGTSGPVPIVGVAVNGNATLNAGFSTAVSPGFNGYLYLYRRDSLIGGGACIIFSPGTDFTTYITNQQTAFTWGFPTDTFQGAPWDQNQTIDLDFFMQFSLLQGGSPSGTGSVRVTSIPTTYVGNAPPNVGPILPLTFVWGCLPAGTLVSKLDGDMPIELITGGMSVLSGPDRRLMNVVRTWKGWEKNPLIHISDDRGLTIRLTSEHPIMTDTGMRLASELTVGTAVLTGDGSFARLLNVEKVDFDGLVYNLDVEPVDATEGDDGSITTFIAGGFVVGDNRMQGECSRLALQRIIGEPPTVPSELALDVENSVRRAAGLPLTLQVTVAG